MFWESAHRKLTFAALETSLACALRQGKARHTTLLADAHGNNKSGLLYVAYMCRPYHTNGYTNRTQALLHQLTKAGRVCAVTRTGYPWDMKLRPQTDAPYTDVEGIRVHHIARPRNNTFTAIYARVAAKKMAEFAWGNGVGRIHAASNHTNALPALFAARQLGIPFQYEMRGLWELSRATRETKFKDSHVYRLGLELEGFVAQHADRLFVISRQLGLYAQQHWNIAASKITLLPNCVDAERICPDKERQVEPGLIGYAGAMVEYEGLDTLIQAIHLMRETCPQARLLLVGDGTARPALERLVGELGLGGRVTFLGKLSPEAAREELQRCALVCIPRKPYPVCEIVPPLKLVEALALAKPVVVPDLPVFHDELGEAPAGYFFKAGDAADLAVVLHNALAQPETLAAMGAKGREYVLQHRQWHQYVGQIA